MSLFLLSDYMLSCAFQPFDAHYCHMGTAIKHPPVPDRVKTSFVIFDSTPTLSPERQSARMSKITNDGLTMSRMLYSCTHMTTVGVKGLNIKLQ